MNFHLLSRQPNSFFALSLLALFALLATSACDTNSTSNQPVASTASNSAGATGNTTTAPPSNEVENRGNILVRVAHLIPGAPSVDLFTDDTKPFTDAAYKTVSEYKEIPAGNINFRLRQAGQDTAQPLVQDDERLSDDGAHYTVLALPDSGGKPDLEFLKDDFSAPSSGKAKVRVIHASPDAGEISVFANGRNDALFDGVDFADENDYKEIDPVNGTLVIRPEGKNITLVTIPNARFDAGKLYTVFVVGNASGAAKLEAVVVTDEFKAPGAMGGNMNANMMNTNNNMNR